MNSSRRFLLAAAASFAVLPAQNCTDNQYGLYLVNSQGVVAPTNAGEYQFATDAVYLAFDPALPTGLYYVQVTDPVGNGDEVLSTNDPQDRFVQVTNNAGVISLSLPLTNGNNPPVFGLGLNGIGQSILLQPFRSSLDEPCRFKAWFGDSPLLTPGYETNPYLLEGGFDPVNNRCRVRSYASFNIGDGSGNDVFGLVFLDADHDGIHDAGETGVPGVEIHLTNGVTTLQQTTGNDGGYRFVDVAHGTWTVELVLGPNSPYNATTPSSRVVLVHDCADVGVADFGVAPRQLACNGHTIGFWRNNHGKALVTNLGILAVLPALHLVNASGQYVSPATVTAWATWLQGANATNMAYMLSAQLAAMYCNVAAGFVDSQCLVNGGSLGIVSIQSLMQQAILSLAAHPYTPSGSPFRAQQQALKNALDAANNNQNWL